MAIPVIFRRYHAGPVIALFPTEPADYLGKYILSYQSIGQHGAAEYDHVMKISSAATPWEYMELKKELEHMGYKLKVKKRASKEMNRKRMNKAKRVWARIAPRVPFGALMKNPIPPEVYAYGVTTGLASGTAFALATYILSGQKNRGKMKANPLNVKELDELLTTSEEFMIEAQRYLKGKNFIDALSLANMAVMAAQISKQYGWNLAFESEPSLKRDADVFLESAKMTRSQVERSMKAHMPHMVNPQMYVPLTKAQIKKVVAAQKKDKAPNSATRILIEGQAMNVETGQVASRGSNVMYHPVYWSMSSKTANMLLKFVQDNNPGRRVTIDYQPSPSAKNPRKQKFNVAEYGDAYYNQLGTVEAEGPMEAVSEFVDINEIDPTATTHKQERGNDYWHMITIAGNKYLVTTTRKPKYGNNPEIISPHPEEIEHLAAQAKELWAKACKWEGVPTESKFVMFSPENPYARQHGDAMMKYFDAMKRYKQAVRDVLAKAREKRRRGETQGNPSLLKKQMMEFLRKKWEGLIEDLDDEAEIAIYWFANDYHGGQWDDLYSILSTSPYTPGPMMTLEKETPGVVWMYRDLEEEFGRHANPQRPGAKKQKSLEEMTLAEHAEAWQRERGKKVPRRGTKAYEKMYQEWHAFAFKDFGKNPGQKPSPEDIQEALDLLEEGNLPMAFELIYSSAPGITEEEAMKVLREAVKQRPHLRDMYAHYQMNPDTRRKLMNELYDLIVAQDPKYSPPSKFWSQDRDDLWKSLQDKTEEQLRESLQRQKAISRTTEGEMRRYSQLD